jgi:hypothetical protein
LISTQNALNPAKIGPAALAGPFLMDYSNNCL